jgi:hypothetical protein
MDQFSGREEVVCASGLQSCGFQNVKKDRVQKMRLIGQVASIRGGREQEAVGGGECYGSQQNTQTCFGLVLH